MVAPFAEMIWSFAQAGFNVIRRALVSRVLFLNQPSVGHVSTLLNIALQMKEDGHEVSFLMPGMRLPKMYLQMIDTAMAIPEMIRKNGIPVTLMRPPFSMLWAGAFLDKKTGFEEILAAIKFMSKGVAQFTPKILKHIELERPDVMVTDFAFLGASIAAEAATIPYATIYHSGLPFRGEKVPPFGSGLPIDSPDEICEPYTQRQKLALQLLDDRINRIRSRFGLKPVQDVLRTPYSPWLNLITSVSAAEVPRDLPRNTCFIGPCFGKRKGQPDFPFEKLKPEKYKIYVSLGTVFNNRPWFFERIMKALDHPDYQVIISAGASFDRLQKKPVPANVLLFRSVPQSELLPKIDLFISHGGNNSINESLAAGKPIIVAPVGGEQGDNAERIVYLELGNRVEIATVGESQIKNAVESIRTNETIVAQAHKIQDVIQETEGLATASHCIARLAIQPTPMIRSDGCPETITRKDWGVPLSGG
jgi:MGT family glycosyltransferase